MSIKNKINAGITYAAIMLGAYGFCGAGTALGQDVTTTSCNQIGNIQKRLEGKQPQQAIETTKTLGNMKDKTLEMLTLTEQSMATATLNKTTKNTNNIHNIGKDNKVNNTNNTNNANNANHKSRQKSMPPAEIIKSAYQPLTIEQLIEKPKLYVGKLVSVVAEPLQSTTLIIPQGGLNTFVHWSILLGQDDKYFTYARCSDNIHSQMTITLDTAIKYLAAINTVSNHSKKKIEVDGLFKYDALAQTYAIDIFEIKALGSNYKFKLCDIDGTPTKLDVFLVNGR